MITTTSIRRLQKDHNLLQGSEVFTNEQVINAAAIVAYKNGCQDTISLYDAIWDECDSSLAMTLNEMDKKELLQYARVHS